ncbi:MAG: TIGR00730 family Rossman fold protein [bacterium]|nr:TIGR00730 family Rossman fold protein [bacterium]
MLKRIWKKVSGNYKGNSDMSDTHIHVDQMAAKKFKDGMRRRMATINSEFRHTFKFLEHYPKSVTFFGSARFLEDHPDYVRARNLAKKVVNETGYTVITGGGPGIMEAGNRGAYEAGGKSIGMNIVLPHEQKVNEYLTANIRFYYFFIRKVALSFSAEVYVFFPGGYGTLDEFYEMLTLVQTKKIPPTPIICIGRDFWKRVMDVTLAMRDEYQTISPGDERLFNIVDTDEEVIEIIKKTPIKKL